MSDELRDAIETAVVTMMATCADLDSRGHDSEWVRDAYQFLQNHLETTPCSSE